MILQSDKRLPTVIQKYGCYFMSILFLANKYKGIELSIEKIKELYSKFNNSGYMDECWILYPDKIFKSLGVNCRYTNKHEKADYYTNKNELEILCLRNTWGTHFVVGDGKGNIAYNPLGLSGEGRMESKRIFRL